MSTSFKSAALGVDSVFLESLTSGLVFLFSQITRAYGIFAWSFCKPAKNAFCLTFEGIFKDQIIEPVGKDMRFVNCNIRLRIPFRFTVWSDLANKDCTLNFQG